MLNQYDFSACIELDGESYTVTFPDMPEAITQGETMDEAVTMAQDALIMALDGYLQAGLQLPEPSRPAHDLTLIHLPYLIQVKLAIYQMMAKNNISKKELSEKLHCDHNQLLRLLDLYDNTELSLIESVLPFLTEQHSHSLA